MFTALYLILLAILPHLVFNFLGIVLSLIADFVLLLVLGAYHTWNYQMQETKLANIAKRLEIEQKSLGTLQNIRSELKKLNKEFE